MNLFALALASGPVRWRRWDDATLAEARERECLIVVLAGAACDHWSAVLAAELAADQQVGELINELFVPVFAEPLEDPALCARVQQVLALTADAGGWPACMICLPDGRPVGATAWRPLRDRDRRQGLLPLLLASAEAWTERPADLVSDAARVSATLRQAGQRLVGASLPARNLLLDNMEAAAFAAADPLNGGFGPPPRGPDATLTRFLIARCRRDGAPLALARQVERHLAAVLAGAIHDQIGGGFHRACGDPSWREPFSEKRLFDNAHWALALFEAAAAFAQDAYAVVAERALRWCFADLGRDDGLCAAGLHASNRDGDGAYYRWTTDQLAAVIGEEGADLVARRYGLDDRPRMPAVLTPLSEQDCGRMPALLQRLAVARAERPAPPRDERLDPSAHGALLAACAAMRARHDAPFELVEHAARLAKSVSAWSELPGDIASTPGQRAWLAIGLAEWDRPRAEYWYRRIGEVSLQDTAVPGLDPLPAGAEDGADGPGAPGLFAWAAIGLGHGETARQVIAAHAGLLRQAPLAATSLAQALDRLN